MTSRPRRKVSRPPRGTLGYSQLERCPEIARQIGIFMGCFAVLERQIPGLLHHLTQHGNHDAEVIAGSFLSNAHKIELIETLLRSRNLQHDDGEFEIAKRFCSKLREANAVRNRFAHSLYARSGRKVFMNTYVSDAKRQSQQRLLRASDIKREIRRIEILIWHLSGYLMRNERPPKRYWLPSL